MCGRLSCFRTEAIGARPDAVVFGKAFGAARHPFAGVIFTEGRRGTVTPPVQRHTYGGSSAAAYAAAAATLAALDDRVYSGIQRRANDIERILRPLYGERLRGQGLLWGVEDAPTPAACRARGVWPYFTGGGLLLTPPLDVCQLQLREAMARLVDTCHDERY